MSSRNRRSRTNQLRRTILILGLLLVILSCCNGARTTQPDIVSPPHHHHRQVEDHKNVQFLGFLPRQFPVPASGPSRKHNDIGLSSTTRTPSP
ncbi:hypothetical protein DY000_02018946 [Brassica cretica]|uniref:Uncharacterized protein n=1 Tax=Brassica cretica TaxID=69181 RepID=A0ABQ7D133_BRACR|nr:hypothetical protein DY000_02018946 [Brassica cretica]